MSADSERGAALTAALDEVTAWLSHHPEFQPQWAGAGDVDAARAAWKRLTDRALPRGLESFLRRHAGLRIMRRGVEHPIIELLAPGAWERTRVAVLDRGSKARSENLVLIGTMTITEGSTAQQGRLALTLWDPPLGVHCGPLGWNADSKAYFHRRSLSFVDWLAELPAALRRIESDLEVDVEPEVWQLNERALAYLGKRDLQGAARALAKVEGRLAAERTVASEMPAWWMGAEFFFHSHRAQLRWMQRRYAEALPDAVKAQALERRLLEQPVVGGSRAAAHASGTWALISTLTALGRTDEAEAAFEAYLSEPSQFWARHRVDSAGAELALLAGTCVYLDPKTPELISRSRRLIDQMTALLPEPRTAALAGQYACLFALYGESDKALAALRRAVALGLSKSAARKDPDLASLRGLADFIDIVA